MSKTVAKAVQVLDTVAEGPRTVSELARGLGVHASTALRMLQPMLDAGLLARGSDGRYRLGLRLAELGQQVLEGIDLRSIARPHLIALAEATRATVHLSQLVDDRIVYVDKIEGAATIRTYSRIGRSVPLHTAAAGKVIMAALPPERRKRLLAGHEFTRYTEHTITDPDQLDECLAEVARRGYATDEAEFEPLVHCVGVGIPDISGRVGAAVSLTTVRASREPGELRRLAPHVRNTAMAIAADLGHQPS
ncbi:IclR family transcriptional regulator [Saccharopolyspora erythraea NRRL 2338]|uniref:Transcriptional regulator, IclR family n=2 Tax=Saccharopolyspora erythraea TaxID=1836 RepID=A4FA12_SACEN|nr:IclR family transcriptional regulator [Saccharopolyspora erythraea]EQD85643.1 ArsR family transcriptional regulator [Saccharopolyspora erythraea D]PFG94672.1 IclR family transcriptional regulator [Saccharopolyspora erythraea NRRL 2338]QRK91402.1 IclR family transcriptional regulator [Saccharopolyspora erythraea]CAM00887.1 transcriptional regulator, IclR family [Saccharopolyspora erythraea NRRL 2338]